jgi:hypothetical protein
MKVANTHEKEMWAVINCFKTWGHYIGSKCHNPTLAKCGDETHTPKVGDLESSETPEFLEFDNKAQNTLH